MSDIQMDLLGASPAQPALNQIVIYAKSNDKRLYVKDDTGVEVKLVTDESTLTDLSAQLPLTSTGGASPSIAINNVTQTLNGAMLATDKIKLDEATELATADQLVKRSALGNASFNEVTATQFNGPATTVTTIPSLSGAVTSNGSNNATTLGTNVVTNANVSPTAGIALTKLAVLPTDRSNHIGSQLAGTISDFGTAVDDHLTGTSSIVDGMISSSANISLSKLAIDPLNRANHTGTQLAVTISDLGTAVNAEVANYLSNNPLTDAEIDPVANIALSKLATNPLDRTNHTGTQLSTSISDFSTAVPNSLTAGDGIDITGPTVSAKGTADRINVSSGDIDIDAAYVGQASINTLGTLTTGTWNASTIGVTYGGTGRNTPGSAFTNLQEVVTESASITLDNENQFVLVDASAAVRTVTLPSAGDIYKFSIKKVDSSANNVIISVNGADTIEGQTSVTLSAQYQYITIVSDGSSTWYEFAKT